jgi:hypothetical protein
VRVGVRVTVCVAVGASTVTLPSAGAHGIRSSLRRQTLRFSPLEPTAWPLKVILNNTRSPESGSGQAAARSTRPSVLVSESARQSASAARAAAPVACTMAELYRMENSNPCAPPASVIERSTVVDSPTPVMTASSGRLTVAPGARPARQRVQSTTALHRWRPWQDRRPIHPPPPHEHRRMRP